MEPTPPLQQRPRESGSERLQRIGCTILTVFVLLLLFCSLIYFVTGLSAIIVRFIEAM